MKMKKWLVLFLFLLFTSANVQAGKVKLATGEWVPFTSEGLENYGFFTEIISEVFKEMGVEAEYVFYPWRRCYDSVKKGKAWAAFPYSYTEERAKEVLYSDQIAYSTTKFFYYKNNKDYEYETLEDLRPYKLGGVIGYFYEKLLNKAGLEVDYVPKELNAIEKLMVRRIELLPLNELVGWHLIKKHFSDEENNFGTLEKAFSRDALHLIVSKKYPDTRELLKEFNAALKRVKENDTYKSILKKYNIEE